VRSQYSSSCFRYDSDFAFPIETSIGTGGYSGHANPDIAYSGVGNQMHVTYISYYVSPSEYWLHNRTLQGTSVSSRLLVRHNGFHGLEDPSVAGSSSGRCLVVWREEWTASDWDILGQRISPYWVYLPCVLKNH